MERIRHLSDQARRLSEAEDVQPQGRVDWVLHRRLRLRAAVWGGAGVILLVLVYVGVLVAANSVEHAVTDFGRLWHWMVPIILGFGLQLGLFAYARGAASRRNTTSARGVVGSGGTSTLSMVACCAHHLTDVLPLIGLAGAAVFLTAYQSIFLLLGLLSNVVGIVYLLGVLRRHGLFPTEGSWLSTAVRWAAARVLPVVVFACTIVLGVGILLAVSRN